MNTMDTLSNLLGIPEDMTAPLIEAEPVDTNLPVPVPPATPPAVIDAKPQDEQDLDDDIAFARAQIKDIAKRASSAAAAAILLAESGDSPKAFEAVARMTEAIVTANKELVELHRTKKETLQPAKGAGKTSLLPTDGATAAPVNIERAVFVGRASDLLRELRKTQKAISDAETS